MTRRYNDFTKPGRWVTQDTIRWYDYKLDRAEGAGIIMFIISCIAAGAAGIIGAILAVPILLLWFARNYQLRRNIRRAEKALAEGNRLWLPWSSEELKIMSGGWGVP